MPHLFVQKMRVVFRCFSAPKGVERACPFQPDVSRFTRSYSFSAPKGVERACPALDLSVGLKQSIVSVPRRALRGHAPLWSLRRHLLTLCFSAPKGVERACPVDDVARIMRACQAFQCPEGR